MLWMAAGYVLMSALSLLCTWIGRLLYSTAWMRFGGWILVLLLYMLPVGLVAAVVGLIRSRGKGWLSALVALVLMFCVVFVSIIFHITLSGGV